MSPMFKCIWFLLTVNLWKIYKAVEKLSGYDSVSTPIYSTESFNMFTRHRLLLVFFTLDLIVDLTYSDGSGSYSHCIYLLCCQRDHAA